MLFAAAVVNPIYIGRQSRLLRKIVCGLFGTCFVIGMYNYYSNVKYQYYIKFFDYYPPHVRKFLEAKDHRYLLLFNYKDAPYKLFDETTKKSLY